MGFSFKCLAKAFPEEGNSSTTKIDNKKAQSDGIQREEIHGPYKHDYGVKSGSD